MAIEGIYLLLDGKVYPWKTLIKKMVADEFVVRVTKINLRKIKSSVMLKFKKEYLGSKDWDIKKLKNAS